MRYVVWIAGISESSNLWTQVALSWFNPPGARSLECRFYPLTSPIIYMYVCIAGERALPHHHHVCGGVAWSQIVWWRVCASDGWWWWWYYYHHHHHHYWRMHGWMGTSRIIVCEALSCALVVGLVVWVLCEWVLSPSAPHSRWWCWGPRARDHTHSIAVCVCPLLLLFTPSGGGACNSIMLVVGAYTHMNTQLYINTIHTHTWAAAHAFQR